MPGFPSPRPGLQCAAQPTIRSRTDIWILERDADADPRPLLATPAGEHSPDVSPDGSWLAYTNDASGREEVYVRRMTGGDEVWRVSNSGGSAPLWSRDSRELYYVDLASRVVAVPTALGTSFTTGEPEVLFQARLEEVGGRQYDVAPDGERFLLNENMTTATNPIVVVHGWGPAIAKLLAEYRADAESR